MYCPHCKKKISRTATTCPFCGQSTHTPVAGMATLRVSCKSGFLQTLNFFAGYYVHISVDDQIYVLKSRKKQMDIPVSVGTHKVRIALTGKKYAKAVKFAGSAMVLAGSAMGSSTSIYMGAAMEDWGKAFSGDGVDISFAAEELLAIPVKLSWDGSIVEDKKA